MSKIYSKLSGRQETEVNLSSLDKLTFMLTYTKIKLLGLCFNEKTKLSFNIMNETLIP